MPTLPTFFKAIAGKTRMLHSKSRKSEYIVLLQELQGVLYGYFDFPTNSVTKFYYQ